MSLKTNQKKKRSTRTYKITENTKFIHEFSWTLARNIEDFRKIKNLTQIEMAKASGLPQTVISNMESGKSNPSLLNLVKVANYCNIPIGDLFANEIFFN